MLNLFNIIYFTPFFFPNGEAAKPKYFIPVYEENNSIVFAYLPTRTLRFDKNNIQHGCLEFQKGNFHCYIFEKDVEITKCDFSFEFDTYLYDFHLNEFNKDILTDIYKVEDIDYEIIGELTKQEKINIINCFLKSKNIKLKVKRGLTQYLNQI
jgi:hypothetical protein